MAIADAIPTIVAARMKEYLSENTVYAARTNRTWQSDATGGSINVVGADASKVSVAAYTEGSTLTYATATATAPTTIPLDLKRAWALTIDDIHALQASPAVLDANAAIAGQKMAEAADTYVRGLMQGSTNGGSLTLPASDDFDISAALNAADRARLYAGFAAAQRTLNAVSYTHLTLPTKRIV